MFGSSTRRSGLVSDGRMAANACASSIASLTTASMRRTKLVQKRDGRELPVALAKIRFEAIENGPIHDPALRNAGVRFRRNRRQDHQEPYAEAVLESEVSGG